MVLRLKVSKIFNILPCSEKFFCILNIENFNIFSHPVLLVSIIALVFKVSKAVFGYFFL